MNLFESDYIKSLMIAAFFVTIIVSAITTVWEEYYSNGTGAKRKKILTAVVAVVISILVADFDVVLKLEWQKVLTNILITISFAILFYSYLGGKYITSLFMWVKKLLPGQGDKI